MRSLCIWRIHTTRPLFTRELCAGQSFTDAAEALAAVPLVEAAVVPAVVAAVAPAVVADEVAAAAAVEAVAVADLSQAVVRSPDLTDSMMLTSLLSAK